MISELQFTDNQKIKIIRLILNLSQAEFAEKLQISQASLSDIEKGKHNFSFQFFRLLVREYPVNPQFIIQEGLKGLPAFTDDALNGLFAGRYPQMWEAHIKRQEEELARSSSDMPAERMKQLEDDIARLKEIIYPEGYTADSEQKNIFKQLEWLKKRIDGLQAETAKGPQQQHSVNK